MKQHTLINAHRPTAVLITVALLLALMAGPLFAFEFGGTVESDTSLGDGGSRDWLEHSDRLILYARGGDPELADLLIRGSYEYTLDELYQFDLTTLRVAGTIPLRAAVNGALGYSAGRFVLADENRFLLSQRVDGLSAQLDTAGLQLRLGAGYTGLVFADTAGLYLTATDIAKYDDDDIFGPQKILAVAEVAFPEIIGRQSLRLSGVGQYDLRSKLKNNEVRLHSYYPALFVDGPIAWDLFYTLGAAGGFGQREANVEGNKEKTTLLGGAGTASLSYLPQRIAWLSVEAGVNGATGDKNADFYFDRTRGDELTMYLPLRSPGTGDILSPDLSNLIIPRLELRLRPFSGTRIDTLRNLGLTLSGYGYFRPTNGATSVSTGNGSSPYVGWEANGRLSFRPFSDVSAALYGGVFVPNASDDAALGSDADTRWETGIDLSISF